MMILYGFGQYARKLLGNYAVPMEQLEVIIDNGGNGKEITEVITWNEFVRTKDRYQSDMICIGVKDAYDEIYEEVAKSDIFRKENILRLNEYIRQYPKSNHLIFQKLNDCKLKGVIDKAKEIGDISMPLLANAKVLANRELALQEIDKGGVVAEVGVAFGGFSEKILNYLEPSKFYAIDMYDEQIKGFWDKNIFEEQEISHFDWYKKKFETYLDKGIMEMRRGLSWDCLAAFPDEFFDYVYLDAAHDYESVKRDVTALYPKMKHYGIIQFNDYTYGNPSVVYGVVPVVNGLINKTESKVLFFCIDKSGYHDIVVQINKDNVQY